ncbi:SPOR domain-containing protein [Siccirubricoccus sp. KC 17139]|uniref:Endolytic peptidoglycan transglycosylase RlpA n=1 Tax=Siccirubricoccus soli TaxID=2899147 RepID=A0ABT1D2V1_9PROT|nr:RlpA-like double-psi beta-barrel domain-containing protein [Siccirubricoccus soli]MCO6416253.1 SPOR domain-containing protein [Siccirubricoccus soli]MCP2682387.1 SPOR domain-containing protein [Siccirubricoccus soli]
MRAGAALLLAALAGLALAGCERRPPPPPSRYVVGEPYSLGGVWSYPREDFALVETGFATRLPDRRAGRLTASNEIFDPDQLMGAHRTLQLPAILLVRNLANGRELRVRVNDRGPAQPGRILGLSARAAGLLGLTGEGAIPVRIAVDEAPSRALAGALPSREAAPLQVAAAPSGAVQREALPPPPGARQGAGRSAAAGPAPLPGEEPSRAELPPNPLPEQVTQYPAEAGRIVIEAGTFFRRDQAQRQATSLAWAGARVEGFGSGREVQYRVRMGPFPNLAAADQALAQLRRSGLPDPKLLVD